MIRALIVDDESLVRRGIRAMLPWEKHGISIEGEASNGEKALRYLEQNETDLLVTDLTMPEMSGFELMEQVEKLYPLLPVVVLTCHRDFEYIQDAMRHGAIDYIVKTQLENQDLDELLERIVARIEKAGITARVSMEARNEDHDRLGSRQEQAIRKWSSLLWVTEQGKHRELSDDLADAAYSWPGRVELMKQLLTEWNYRLPWLTEYRWGETIARLDEWADMRGWLGEFQSIVHGRLRQTMLSEEILALIIRSLDDIQQAAGQKINQSAISAALNVSRSYFSRCFKEIVGVSFTVYVQNVNIRYAQLLLETTNHPIYVIADQSGFQDERYFSKMFKEKTGLLPSEYRHMRFSRHAPQ